jgi:hypothetical protein
MLIFLNPPDDFYDSTVYRSAGERTRTKSEE